MHNCIYRLLRPRIADLLRFSPWIRLHSICTMDDVIAARDAGLSGIIIGRALYEGTIDLKEALEGAVDAS